MQPCKARKGLERRSGPFPCCDRFAAATPDDMLKIVMRGGGDKEDKAAVRQRVFC
jgi:hypothetical protein